MDSAELHSLILSKPAIPQVKCPLFTKIPPELRRRIFFFALSDFWDVDKANGETDDGSFSHRKSDARLLQTCRAVYLETWNLPLSLQQYRYNFTWKSSTAVLWPYHKGSAIHDASLYYIPNREAHLVAEHFARFAPERNGGRLVRISELRVLVSNRAQLGWLPSLLRTPHLHPRRLTIIMLSLGSIQPGNPSRRSNFKLSNRFKFDPRLLDGDWIGGMCESLSYGVEEIVIKVETFEARKHQLDYIVEDMCDKWFFRQKVGATLFADIARVTSRARIEEEEWPDADVRGLPSDAKCVISHTVSEPRSRRHRYLYPPQNDVHRVKMQYYTVTVPFRPARVVRENGGQVSREAEQLALDSERLVPRGSESSVCLEDMKVSDLVVPEVLLIKSIYG